jgi:hypothetical protein
MFGSDGKRFQVSVVDVIGVDEECADGFPTVIW